MYKLRITAFWKHWRYQQHRFESLLQWWDAGKSYIKAITIEYAKGRRKKLEVTRMKFEKRFEREMAKIQHGDLYSTSRAEHFKSKLNFLNKEEIKGRQVRCRALWLEQGETSSTFFRITETVRSKRNYIACLTDSNGSKYETTEKLFAKVKEYCAGLYRKVPSSVEAQNHVLSEVTVCIGS